jgi:predicted O-methyltransferase YrrM
MYGGSLRRWLGILPIGGCAVVVDDTMRLADEWREWAAEADVELHLLHGHSQDPGIVTAAQSLGPYDFCFIDADHTYEAVSDDWLNFGPLSSVVAFHDIIERPGYGVSQVWQEIKAESGRRWMEINATVPPEDETRNGIGIVWT